MAKAKSQPRTDYTLDDFLAAGYRVPQEQAATAAPEAQPSKRTTARAAGDVGLALGQGAVGAFKSISDIFGADNAVSSTLGNVNEGLQNLKSDQSKATLANSQRRIQEAEATGDWKNEVAATMQMLWDQPAEMLAQGAGSFATLGIGKLAQAAKLTQAAKAAGVSKAAFLATDAGKEAAKAAAEFAFKANVAVGAGQGVGAVKGSQYEQTLNAAKAQGVGDAEARALASEAQAYGGPGTMQQLLGGVLGAGASATGPIERMVAGKAVSSGPVTLMGGLGKGFATEGATEGAQGAQERYAGNEAAIDAGVLDESARWRGVAGQGVQEGVVGGLLGAMPGGIEAMGNKAQAAADAKAQAAAAAQAEADAAAAAIRANKQPGSGPLTNAVNAGTEADAQKVELGARLGSTPMADMLTMGGLIGGNQIASQIEEQRLHADAEVLRSQQAEQFVGRNESALMGVPSLDGSQDPLAGILSTRRQAIQDVPSGMAERRRTDGTVLTLPTADPVRDYVDGLRQVNTPAARFYVGEFDAGRITPADVRQRMQVEQGKTPDERLADAAAQAPKSMAQTGYLLNKNGEPFKTLMSARLAAKKTPGEVVEVPGGYAVRAEQATPATEEQQAQQQAATPATAMPPDATPESSAQSAILGRNSQPIAEGGQPFSTREEAKAEKRLHPLMRVAPAEGGGFILKPASERQLAAVEKAAKRLKYPSTGETGPRSLHGFILQIGGLASGAMPDVGFDMNPRVGNRRLFSPRGKTIEQAAIAAKQEGYIQDEDENTLIEALKRSLNVSPVYTPDGYEAMAEAQMQARYEDFLAAEQDGGAENDWSHLTPEELADTGYNDYDEATQAEIRALVAQAEALGIDAESILEDVARRTENATQKDYENAAKSAIEAAIRSSEESRSRDLGQASAEAGPATAGTQAEPTAVTGPASDIRARNLAALKARMMGQKKPTPTTPPAPNQQATPAPEAGPTNQGATNGQGQETLLKAEQPTGAAAMVSGAPVATTRKDAITKASDAAYEVLNSGGTADAANRAATDSLIGDMGNTPGIRISVDAPAAVKAATSRISQAAPILTSPTKADIEAQQARAEQAAKAKSAQDKADAARAAKERERKEVAAASVAAADTFELGQDAMANLTGQQDVFGAMEQEAPQIEAEQSERMKATLSQREELAAKVTGMGFFPTANDPSRFRWKSSDSAPYKSITVRHAGLNTFFITRGGEFVGPLGVNASPTVEVGKYSSTEKAVEVLQAEIERAGGAQVAAKSTQPTPPKATELTPKQYHEAKLAFIAADTGASMADVRENYDTEAGRAENDREWAGQVERAANAGEVMTSKTLDKLYKMAPNVRLPETAIPQGYQRPEARKAEAEDKQARIDGRKAAKAGAKAEQPTVSANTIFTEDAAAKARARLKSKLGSLNSGLDPEMMMDGITLAGYHIEKGARTFAAYARAMIEDLGDGVKPYLKSWYMGVKYDPRAASFDGMDGAAAVEAADINALTAQQETQDVPSPNTSVERDSRQPATEPAVGDVVQDGRRPDATGDNQVPGQPSGSDGGRQPDGVGVPADGPVVDGIGGDLSVHSGDAKRDAAVIATGAEFSERGSGIGNDGVSAEPVSTGKVAAVAQSSIDKTRLALKQKQADGIGLKYADLDNIKATLPMLLDGQQEDVFKAETRFQKPDGYGMLFTNGTGTGKTFTGLGIIKRMERQGKTNILVVVPDEKIGDDWIGSSKLLGLNVSKLADTKDAGKGIVLTTYANLGSNDALATRAWDLVVADEAHNLMKSADGTVTTYLQNLRAITMHPDGALQRYAMLNREKIDRSKALSDEILGLERMIAADSTTDQQRAAWDAKSEALQKELGALRGELDKALNATRADVKANQGAKRTRLAALSATPFAYEFTIDWANGYLFDYNDGQASDETESRGYNSGSNRERFFMQHFGYSMRYNKLTKPDPTKVDTGLMQRSFNTMLKKAGSLSGRMLDVKADYDRRFVLVDSAIGNQIDEALNWISDMAGDSVPGFSTLRDVIGKKFDYLSRRYLLEAIKAKEAVPIVRKHMEMGRKVVVFHDYKKGGGFNPFNVSMGDAAGLDSATEDTKALAAAIDSFKQKFAALVNTPFQSLLSPIEVFRNEFPGVLLINGDEKKADLLARYKAFQDDATGPQVALVQSAKNAGWSGHDTTGKHQRVLINLGQPTAPTLAIQQEGRIYRTGQVSNAIMRYMNTGTNWEKWAFATTIAGRASAAENLGMGELSRALKDSFIGAFEESDAYPPGHEGEGTGGKERDAAQNNQLTAWDRAKSLYWATQKKNNRTKAQEGVDYFATPEPVGMKMAEWLGSRGGERTLEPSAGHGAIARWLPETTKRTVIEPSNTLRSRLALVMNPSDDRILDVKFEALDVVNKFDGIAMNPPFGVGGKTAIDHMEKAATHLADGGRIVALIPTGPAADKRFDQWMYGESVRPAKPLHKDEKLGEIYQGDTITFDAFGTKTKMVVHAVDKPSGMAAFFARPKGADLSGAINLRAATGIEPTGQRTVKYKASAGLYTVGEVLLPSVTFERAGTAVSTRIVVLEKQSKAENAPNQKGTIDLSGLSDINDLFDRMENMTMPERKMTDAQKAEVEAEQKQAEASAVKTERNEAAKKQSAAVGDKVTLAGKEYDVVVYTTNAGKEIRGAWVKTKELATRFNDRTFQKKPLGWFVREKDFPRTDASQKPSVSRAKEQPLTPAATIRAAITKAYGNLLEKLEGKGLVTIAQTEREAIEAAAQARADKTGGDVEQIKRSMLASVQASRSPMKSVDANVRRGREALAKALDEKTTVHRAMFRNGLGWVDFVWGSEGVVKPSGKTKGAMGISHILEARQRKDGLTDAQTIRLLEDLIAAIASGREVRRSSVGPSSQLVVEHNGIEAVLTQRPGSNAWLLTGWEIKNPDVSSAGNAAPGSTPAEPTATRNGRVAGFAEMMGLNGLDVKRSSNGNIEGFFDRQTGKSFLVADNLTAASAPGTLMHEVGIHMAADGKLEPLFKRAGSLLKTGTQNEFIQRVKARMARAGETSDEEAAAYIVTEYESDRAKAPITIGKWLADLTAAVRAWLFSKGVILKADQLTVADIAAVARANARSMARGGPNGGPGGGQSFSKSDGLIEWADRESAPVGSWVKADYKLADSQPVYQMREMQIADLYLPELTGDGRLQPEKRRYVDQYAERSKAGEKAPAISVIEMENGRMRVVDGHRRVMAAKAAGQTTVRALVSPLVATPDGKVEATAENIKLSRTALPATLNIDGKDRPTTNSNGQPIHPTEEGVRNFWRWFGESKVVDEQGRPLVVYHGTTADFSEFISGKEGVHFGTVKQASMRASGTGKNLMPVYLKIEDFQRSKDLSGKWSAKVKSAKSSGKDGVVYLNRYEGIDYKTIERAERDGFNLDNASDASVREFAPELEDSYIVFSPTQIKSVFNTGAFSPTDPDIRFSRAADMAGNAIDKAKQTADKVMGKDFPRAASMPDLNDDQRSLLGKVGASQSPASDAIKAATDRAGLKIRQGMVDRFAALKELDEKALGQNFIADSITNSAWVLAKMSSAGAGALNAMMKSGRIEMDAQQKVIGLKGAPNGGLTASLQKLGGPAEVERFFAWVAANRSHAIIERNKEAIAKTAEAKRELKNIIEMQAIPGKTAQQVSQLSDARKEWEKIIAKHDPFLYVTERLFTEDEVAAGRTLNTGTTEEGKVRPALYSQVHAEFQQYRDDVLAIAEQAGIINGENRAMWRDEFYVPFYRVMEDDADRGRSGGNGLSRQEAYKKLKGGKQNLNDLMENTLMNFHHLLSASLKNQAAVQAIKNAESVGIARKVPEARRDTKTSTFVLVDGRKVFYEVDDPLVFESITTLADPGLNNTAVRVMGAFKRLFTNMTTATPQFIIANTFRDLLQASATSPTSKNIAKNLKEGIQSYRDEKTRAEMLASGGAFSFGHIYGMHADEVKASLQKTVAGAGLISSPSMIPSILRKGWDAWGDITDLSENASRAATYAQSVDQMGKLRAAFEARDVMDFSQHGAWPAVRLLVRIVPFLNARLQGLDKLYRSGLKPSILTAMGKGTDTDKQAAARFAMVTGALTLATMALYLVNADDDEYKKLEEWQKDTYWFIRIGENAFFLPKPFEVGAIATVAERTLQQAMDDKATGKLFMERMWEMLMQTFAFNPTPQMFQPLIDVYSNKDAFTGRDIESAGMERMSTGFRSRDTTTAPATALSAVSRVFGDESAIAVSPVQADHLIKGYLGGVGATAAGWIDTMYRAATGQSSPDKAWAEYQPIRRFYRDLDVPVANTRYTTMFYDGLKEANRVYADVMELQKLGRTEEAQALATEKRSVLQMRIALNAQQRRLTDINNRMKEVRRSDKDGEWKRRELDLLTTQKALITERLGKRIEDARAQ